MACLFLFLTSGSRQTCIEECCLRLVAPCPLASTGDRAHLLLLKFHKRGCSHSPCPPAAQAVRVPEARIHRRRCSPAAQAAQARGWTLGQHGSQA
eukprot:scaffold296284_cov14-Tisochrysis_lutea.AAC.1